MEIEKTHAILLEEKSKVLVFGGIGMVKFPTFKNFGMTNLLNPIHGFQMGREEISKGE